MVCLRRALCRNTACIAVICVSQWWKAKMKYHNTVKWWYEVNHIYTADIIRMKKLQPWNLKKNYAIAKRSIKKKNRNECHINWLQLLRGAVPILYFREMVRNYYKSNKRSKSVEILNYFRLLLVTGHFRVTILQAFVSKRSIVRGHRYENAFLLSCKENSLSAK